MARRRPTNPIDPETGKRRRGRPPKKAPIDTIQDIPADDQNAIVVRPLDPREEVSTSLQEEWKRRFRGSNILEVPQELKDKYPDGQFAYARNTAECISMYRTKYGYEIAEANKPLPGQTDSTFVFGDAVCMVRPKWMKKAHDQVRREAVIAQTSNASPEEVQAQSEAAYEARRAGYDSRRDIAFMREEFKRETPEESLENDRRDEREYRPKGAKGRGSKYWSGGINS